MRLAKQKVDELEDDRDFHESQLSKIIKLNRAFEKYIEEKNKQAEVPLPLPMPIHAEEALKIESNS